ncbi:MAG: bifunctional phosphopantothenoylcysteine decarboxylase/phosphopantothenate--cysteine ligase CoaBC, partial [Candidatus Lokiarchaeota archaeon]|nr:bifunctional phosphopantothenoylcysteine decarboxylase/phosphopantothenate--cysteine ligase CoaBC [Candidatus Lokiarchaeota archaeon]
MKFIHPSKDIKASKGNILENKTICVCLTGSVSVVNSPDLCRLLMRYGADVITVMSKAATKLIGSELLKWATGNEVITELTGDIEHIMIAGERPAQKGKADLVVIAPATANT